PDAPQVGLGEALGEPLPCRATVGGFEQAIAGTMGLYRGINVGRGRHLGVPDKTVEFIAQTLPTCQNQDFRIGGAYHEVEHACLVVLKPDTLPGLAPVRGLVQTPFLARPIKPAQRSDVDDVGVLRVNDDLADLVRLFQALVLPRLAAVRRTVDPIAE